MAGFALPTPFVHVLPLCILDTSANLDMVKARNVLPKKEDLPLVNIFVWSSSLIAYDEKFGQGKI